MDVQTLKDEIQNIRLSDLSKDEKSAKIIELARELGRILLEGDQKDPGCGTGLSGLDCAQTA